MQTNADAAPRQRSVLDLLDNTWVALACALAVALIVAQLVIDEPSQVDLTVVNDTPYDLTLEATSTSRDGWAPIAIVPRETTAPIRDVFDQGEVWIFHFRGQGYDAGELRVERSELDASHWTLEIPTRVGDRLRAQGAPPSTR